MTIIRVNGKVTTTTRAVKRRRRHARKSNERQTNEHHLANLRLQAFNYNAKQSRRWLRARLLSEDRGFVIKEAGLQLATYFEKTEFQLQHPRITDAVLTANARWVLSQLEVEWETARKEQGYPERVQDWWAAPIMVGKRKRKGKKMGQKDGAAALQIGSTEGLQDGIGALRLGEEDMEEMEEGEGVVLLGGSRDSRVF